MVTLTNDEIFEMRQKIAAGELPADAEARHFENEAKNVFGADARKDRNGRYIEQGIGSAQNITRNSIEAFKRYCSGEVNFDRTLAQMEKQFADQQAKKAGAAQRQSPAVL
jgi:hypothetical protein